MHWKRPRATGEEWARGRARLWLGSRQLPLDMGTTNDFAIAFLQAQSGGTRGKINQRRNKRRGVLIDKGGYRPVSSSTAYSIFILSLTTPRNLAT